MGRQHALQALSRRDMLRCLSLGGAGLGLAACGGGGNDDTPTDPVEGGGNGSGGGGGGNPGGGTPPAEPTQAFSKPGQGTAGTPVTVEQRQATFQALEAKLSELWDFTTGRASAGAVLAWLEAQPVFKTVGYSRTRDVYAIFTDGRPLLVITRFRSDTQGVRAAPAHLRERSMLARRAQLQRLRSPGRERTAEAALPAGITKYDAGIPSRRFRYLNTWYDYGPDWPADTWARGTTSQPQGVASMADPGMVTTRMVELGYERVPTPADPHGLDSAPSVEGLKSVSGDGVFYWMTHGGTLDPDGHIIQGLMTGTDATQTAVEVTYKNEFDEGTLIYCTGPLCLDEMQCNVSQNKDGTNYTRLAITPKWIKKYEWRFGKHSLVFVNACASGTGAMKQAFLDAGASLYLGWTAPVRAWAMCGATVDVLSLMMGFNENSGSDFDNVPMQRPYDWGAVFDLLNTQGKSQAVAYWDDEDGYVELEPTLNPKVPVGFLGLRPSIFQTSFNEETSELTLIGGVFGTDQGTAAVGTDHACVGGKVACTLFGSRGDFPLTDPVPVAVVDWKPENVILKLPVEGPGSHGLVQVTVDGRCSNLMQVTRITVPVKGTLYDGGSLKVEIQGELSLRCDLRGSRLDPIETPRHLPMVAVSSAVSSKVTYQASGAFSYAEGDEMVTVAWAGSGEATNRSPLGELAMITGTINPQARTAALMAFFGVVIDETITRRRAGYPDQVSQSRRGVALNAEAGGGTPDTFPVQPAFDARYAAAAVRHDATRPGAGVHQSAVRTVLDFGPFSSVFPPSDELGGR